MNDKQLRKFAKTAIKIAVQMEVEDKVRNTDIPLEEIYERYFDAPEPEKNRILAELQEMRDGNELFIQEIPRNSKD